jgi:hypothetical protein
LKDEDLELIEKINRIRKRREELKWEKRYYEVKSYIVILAIGLLLAWFVIFLILIGIL